MSKKSATKRKPKVAGGAPPQVAKGASPSTSPWLLVLGAMFAGFALVMSLLLVLEHFGGLSLPGCGPGGACDQAAESVWGKVKLGDFEWPVSHLGLAYFGAVLAAWLASRAATPSVFRYLVRIGALGSLGFCAIIAVEWLLCVYCLAAHAGNFAFWIAVERARSRPARTRLAVLSFIGVFALLTGVLGMLEWQHRDRVLRKGEEELAEATQSIIERSHRAAEPATQPAAAEPVAPAVPVTTEPAATEPAATPPAPSATAPSVDQPVAATTEPAPSPPFVGRYRFGPEAAPIRIVLFTGYQCRDCYSIEQQLMQLMAERNDISVSIKHFPFNKECNPFVERDLHPNACWAARAAEAAGILWGSEGFWKMHHWLFSKHGVFETTAQLEAGIRELGYDPTGFVAVMSGEEPLRRIREDVEEGKALGLFFTPMIFINGVELKGWYAPNALLRTVAEVAATNPPARTAHHDHPPAALEKCVADWRDQPVRPLPADAQAWVQGAADGAIRIVVWGDYQERYTAEVDAIIRAFVARRGDAGYTFRQYPFNSDCNPHLNERRHPQACRAAQAAEAAGQLGGVEAFGKMHAWLMERQGNFNDEALLSVAGEFGLDADAFLAAMGSDAVQAAIADDIQAGKQLPSLRWGTPPGLHAIPTVFINSRYVPRVRLDDKSVLDLILEAAAADAQ